jgi:poly(hydroxyalkanoate) granule-associated protein
MVTTRKSIKPTAGIPAIKDSAYSIWLAGLGAFSLAGEEGSKLFQQLVEKGTELEQSNKDRITQLGEKMEGLKDDAKAAVQKLATPIENTINSTIHSAIQKLGVPTRDEIVTLTKRVEELTKAVAAAKAKPKTTRRPGA